MGSLFYDFLIWTIPLAVSFYTLTYARWLLGRKNKRGALGVAALALLTALYPGIVLFFVHR